MAGFRLPCLKSLVASLGGFSSRASQQQRRKLEHLIKHQQRAMSSTASNVNLSSERNDNVVYSRHEDCFLHNQTMVQRFFQQASLWPNHVAMVKYSYYYLIHFKVVINASWTNNWLGTKHPWPCTKFADITVLKYGIETIYLCSFSAYMLTLSNILFIFSRNAA